MNKTRHIVAEVSRGSIAEELEIVAGDEILTINGEEIEDIFDYQFLCENEYIEVGVRKESGEEWILEIDKEEDEDLGIKFENGLMDEYHSCSNKCIFCFIDQMPPGMRKTLYFKDDDARLSFLQGNYVTLTNMSENDIERIIKYNLSPINISFHTTNPELRCMMLNNRFAGKALEKAKRFYEAGLVMNGQIVLCKGVNDKDELERTISDLYGYLPYLQSVSIVPVGVTKYRDGLYKMDTWEKEDAEYLIDQVEKWQKKAYAQYGLHFVHASDEWYINAKRPLPEAERYDGYLQIANGVGTMRSMIDEFEEELANYSDYKENAERVTVICGELPYEYIKMMADRLMNDHPLKDINVVPIKNRFFGESITVTGLLTGQDIVYALKDKDLGNRVLLSENILKADEEIFLDDMTLNEFKEVLQVRVSIVQSNGYDFVDCILES
jgi:putative radical SAM enzyme (TIGR03279 family)